MLCVWSVHIIRAAIFDFDGVLVESSQIKTNAFRELFLHRPEKVDEIVAYHLKHAGVTRYIKFKYIHESILKEPYSDNAGLALSGRFSGIVLDKVKNAPLVHGVETFLEEHYKTYLFFIASGTPQGELDDIVSYKGLQKYFAGVFGAPATKGEIVDSILKKYKLKAEEVIFVGDAEVDRNAAENAHVHFVLRVTPENYGVTSTDRINDFTELKNKIEEIKL